MEATLEAEARDKREERGAPAPRGGPMPAVVYGAVTGGGQRGDDARSPSIRRRCRGSCTRSPAPTRSSASARGRERPRCWSRTFCSIRSPTAAARRLLSRRDGSQVHRHRAGHGQGRAARRQAAGRHPRLRHTARSRSKCLPARHSRAHRSGRHRADAGPGHPHPRRRDGREVEAGERARHDAGARGRAAGRGSGGGDRDGGGRAGGAGRARGHQEGQEGQGRGEKKEAEEVAEAGRRSRQPGQRNIARRGTTSASLVVDELARRAGVAVRRAKRSTRWSAKMCGGRRRCCWPSR